MDAERLIHEYLDDAVTDEAKEFLMSTLKAGLALQRLEKCIKEGNVEATIWKESEGFRCYIAHPMGANFVSGASTIPDAINAALDAAGAE